jgi:siroheme synthase-like protein
MENYPIFLNIQHFKCLVVGGGKVACRKVKNLVDAGAKPVIISIELYDELSQLVHLHALEVHTRPYVPTDMHGFQLIIAATSNQDLNDEIAQQAIDLKLLVNNISNATLCTFQMPAVVKRKGLELAIGTGGDVPLVSHRLKQYFEEKLSDDKMDALAYIAARRKELLASTQAESGCRKDLLDAELMPLVDEFIQKLFL